MGKVIDAGNRFRFSATPVNLPRESLLQADTITPGTMHTLRELNVLPVWVNPSHMVETAIHVMNGHEIPAIGVVDGGELIGWLSLDRATLLSPTVAVEDAMEPVCATLQDTMSVREAAKEFVRIGATYLPVLHGGQFVGMLSSTMMLGEVDSGYDPLTDLPWSDKLRDWGRAQLDSGQEITLIFFDLDDFGAYNKRHGHIVGDKVLKGFANFLRNSVRTDRDVVVRYGGDEFVIGTPMLQVDAVEEFRSVISESVRIPDIGEPLRFSVGMSGGKRQSDRSDAHIAAMLEDLINLASVDCMRRKEERHRVRKEISAPTVLDIDLKGDITKGFVTVKCRAGSEEYVGTSPKTDALLTDVARATVNALHVLTPEPGYTLKSTKILTQDDLLIATAVITYQKNGIDRIEVVSAPVLEDQFMDLATAIFVPFASKSH